MVIQHIESFIRNVPDFPKPGIIFKDITPLLQNSHAFHSMIDLLAIEAEKKFDLNQITQLVGIESRGFILASALAYRLKKGMVLIRKPNKLPYKKISQIYELEYGHDQIEMHQDAVLSHDRVLIVDDVLATGGTAEAAVKLVEKNKAQVAGLLFLIELDFLSGSKRLPQHSILSMLHY